MTAHERPAAGAGRDFNLFVAEKLRPIIAEVAAKRRAAVRRSLAAAAATFVAFLGVAHYFLSPYLEILREHGISHWPLLVLMPATMAVISFSLVHILSLRTLADDFKSGLLRRTAEYIDSACVHETGRTTSAADLEASLLFTEAEAPRSGREHFRGSLGTTGYEFTDITLNAGGKQAPAGIFFTARFKHSVKDFTLRLPPDTDAAWMELPPAFRPRAMALLAGRNAEVRASCRGNLLAVYLPAGSGTDGGSILDGFDFGNYREFCGNARLCLSLAEALELTGTI